MGYIATIIFLIKQTWLNGYLVRLQNLHLSENTGVPKPCLSEKA